MAEFTKREMDILLILLAERDWITGEEIAGRLGISKKTVQQEIRMIEETLGLEAGLCSGQKKGYRLNGVSQEQLQRILMCLEENEAHYNMKDRTSVLALYLLFQRDYVTMDRLAEIFYLSKTTVFSEIKTLKRWMGRQGGITLEVSGTKGVLIRGKEMDRRFRCATFCMTGILKQILLDERELQQYEQELAAIRTELGTELAEADIRICGEDFGKICRYLAVSLLRNRLGFQGEDDEEPEKREIPEQETAFRILGQMESRRPMGFGEKEAAGLAELLYFSRVLPQEDERKAGEQEELESRKRMEQLEKELERLLGASPGSRLFSDREQFFRHFIRMERRIARGRNATNYYDKELAAAGPLETHVMELACRRIFRNRISRAERMFLSVYLDLSELEENSGIDVLLVSNQSAGITAQIETFVREQLEEITGQFRTEPVYLFEAGGGKVPPDCLALTTEGGEALLHPEFHLFPVTLQSRERKWAGQMLRNWKDKWKERKLQETLEACRQKDQVIKGGGRLQELLEQIGWQESEVTATPLQDGLLCLCRFQPESEPLIRLCILEHTIEVEKKDIRRVLMVSWNGKRQGRGLFFQAVSQLLENGCNPVQKKLS